MHVLSNKHESTAAPVWSAEERADRDFVVSFMHYNGENTDRLKPEEKKHVYFLIMDGFGKFENLNKTAQDYLRETWDWSHVRDASPKAHTEAAEFIRNLMLFEK